jgi:hypothetical protein
MEGVYIITIGQEEDPDAYPETISKFWLPIEQMKSLYPYNQNFQLNVHTISRDECVIGWKKSRGDGNCYFRAVISTYFLEICKNYNSVSLLHFFKQKIENLITEDVENSYLEAQSEVLKVTEKFINMKNNSQGCEVFDEALKLTQNRQFDLNLVRVSRLLTMTELLKNKDHEDYSFMFLDGVDYFVNDILEMDKEGGDLSLVFLPKTLDIQVTQFMFLDKERFSIQKFPEESRDEQIKIMVIRRSGHYDILYHAQIMELDGACISEGTYFFLKSLEYYDLMKNEIRNYNQSIRSN